MFTVVSHDISVFIFTAPRDERSEQTCRQTYMGHAHIHTYTVYILVHLILTGLMDSLLYVLNSLFSSVCVLLCCSPAGCDRVRGEGVMREEKVRKLMPSWRSWGSVLLLLLLPASLLSSSSPPSSVVFLLQTVPPLCAANHHDNWSGLLLKIQHRSINK